MMRQAYLKFCYGAMGCGKTRKLQGDYYSKIEDGFDAIIMKPIIDTKGDAKTLARDGNMLDVSFLIKKEDNIYLMIAKYLLDYNLDFILVDEAQFLTEKQVDALASIVDNENIPVICYGLKTDFQSHLFEGSKRLLEIANVIEEIPTICWCGKKAIMNARVIDGKMVDEGSQILLGGNESYTSLCRKHYQTKDLGKAGR